ncbi:hypothetical protein LS70_008555 [Helicobacter sp. MIT 11-5569]|uniref:cytochrome P460 family protein n=1 Tax=Helicobacter sp. MIT 11-5569 TaxID=1548151 RepID=UPI00051FE052|nr:cytochrome P460 family protein [Helicobacter sp. MIT 11-5569]TLD81167.1 hypothetical protein LS70_008555 [Helicobacter sp. MIT 11-5569]
MRTTSIKLLGATLIFVFIGGYSIAQLSLTENLSFADSFEVISSQSYKNSIHYTSVMRGSIIEDMFIDKDVINALQQGKNLPNGTLIVMEEYHNQSGQRGQINRYITMQKVNNDWEFEAFNADKSRNYTENTQRCYDCHKNSISGEDIVFTLDKIKAFKLK